MDIRLRPSGHFARYAYDQGILVPGHDFPDLEARGHIKPRALAVPADTPDPRLLPCDPPAGTGRSRGRAGAMTTPPPALRALALCASLLLLGGCAILREFAPRVEAEPLGPGEYIALKRSDILTSDELSPATLEALRVAGLDDNACMAPPAAACMPALAAVQGLDDERRLAALAELWTQQAIALTPRGTVPAEETQIAAWLEVARHAYAYLFFSERAPGERAFEDRQTQVRDYYNYAVQQAAAGMFERWRLSGETAAGASRGAQRVGGAETIAIAGWRIDTDLSGLHLPEGVDMPRELVPASSISFAGLRSIYRRDGFGAEVVAVMGDDPVTTAAVRAGTRQGEDPGHTRDRQRRPEPAHHAGEQDHRPRRFTEMPSPTLTLLIRFTGDDLASVLATREAQLSVHDPYSQDAIELHGLRVPLSANYSAGYGLWLARSGFNRQSLQTLFGREHGIVRPHLYMMQPYDPDRRILIMIHGLASSPEAWVNVANEVLGDDVLRREFQIWQVYYPTNMPLVLNQSAIRRVIMDARAHFDPEGAARASQGGVLIGHSMGGVLSRLLVSTADEQLWDWMRENYAFDDGRLERATPRLERMLRFEPLPGVERVVFIASPHRGTTVAGSGLGRLIARLVRLPLTVIEEVAEVFLGEEFNDQGDIVLANSIDNLSEDDSFVRAAAELPISPRVRYHSIIAHADPAVPLEESDDGLVPYRSAHLPGAVSEKVITSGHSVQETAPAILEIRRILHRDLREAVRRR